MPPKTFAPLAGIVQYPGFESKPMTGYPSITSGGASSGYPTITSGGGYPDVSSGKSTTSSYGYPPFEAQSNNGYPSSSPPALNSY